MSETETKPRSRAKQLADDEAARIEAEEAAAAAALAEGVEQPAEPDLEERDPQEVAKLLDALERSYVDGLIAALGPHFADLHPCPTCAEQQLGFVFDLPATGPDYRRSELTEACPDCGGWGDVLTGAKVERGMLDQCNTCGGKGFVFKLGTPPAAAVAPAAPAALPPLPPIGDGEPRDQWGRRSGHAHWGIPPDSIG